MDLFAVYISKYDCDYKLHGVYKSIPIPDEIEEKIFPSSYPRLSSEDRKNIPKFDSEYYVDVIKPYKVITSAFYKGFRNENPVYIKVERFRIDKDADTIYLNMVQHSDSFCCHEYREWDEIVEWFFSSEYITRDTRTSIFDLTYSPTSDTELANIQSNMTHEQMSLEDVTVNGKTYTIIRTNSFCDLPYYLKKFDQTQKEFEDEIANFEEDENIQREIDCKQYELEAKISEIHYINTAIYNIEKTLESIDPLTFKQICEEKIMALLSDDIKKGYNRYRKEMEDKEKIENQMLIHLYAVESYMRKIDPTYKINLPDCHFKTKYAKYVAEQIQDKRNMIKIYTEELSKLLNKEIKLD